MSVLIKHSTVFFTFILFQVTFRLNAQERTVPERLAEQYEKIADWEEESHRRAHPVDNSVLQVDAKELFNFFSDQVAINKIQTLQKQGRLQETMPLLNGLINQYPNEASLYSLRGRTYGELDHTEQAVSDFASAIKINANYGPPYAGLAIEERKSGKQREALQHITRALSIEPGVSDYHVILGDIYNDRKEFEKALDCYNQASVIDPSNATLYLGRSVANFNLKRLNDARLDAIKAWPVVRINNNLYFYLYAVAEESLNSPGRDFRKSQLMMHFKITDKQADSVLLAQRIFTLKRRKIAIDKNQPVETQKQQLQIGADLLMGERRLRLLPFLAESQITTIDTFFRATRTLELLENRNQVKARLKSELSLPDFAADSVVHIMVDFMRETGKVSGGPQGTKEYERANAQLFKLINERKKRLRAFLSKDQMSQLDVYERMLIN